MATQRAACGTWLGAAMCTRTPDATLSGEGEATYLDYFRSFGLLMARDLTRGLFSAGNTNNSLSCIAIPGLGLPSADETWCDCVASPKSLRMAVPERSWDGFTSITSYPRAFAHLSKSKTGGKVWVRVGLGRVDDEKARLGVRVWERARDDPLVPERHRTSVQTGLQASLSVRVRHGAWAPADRTARRKKPTSKTGEV